MTIECSRRVVLRAELWILVLLMAGCGQARDDRPDLDSVIAACRSDDLAARRRATHVLAAYFGKRAVAAVPVLTIALRDPDPRVAGNAARALRKIGPEARSAVPTLVAVMQSHQEADVAKMCARAIGSIATNASLCVPALRNVLRAGKVDPEALLMALASFGPGAREAVPEVMMYLGGEHAEHALDALGSIGAEAEAAIPAILLIQADPTRGELREIAEGALIGIGAPAVPIFVERVRNSGSLDALDAIGHIGPDARSATPVLVEVLESPERVAGAWSKAVWALMRVGHDETWRPRVLAALKRAASRGVTRAKRALARLPPE
jgi:HEAT repeat protein